MRKGTFLLLIASFVGLCAYLFISFYDAAEKIAIRQLNEQQLIHAQQASQGIGDFFKTWTGILESFAKMNEVVSVDADGKRYLALFYEAHYEQIRSITRVDEKGRILYTVPYSPAIGSDISGQKHVRKILRDHELVVSDVFQTVQGFYGVALHVPVFKGATFRGTIAVVIDFEGLARRYLEAIKIGKTGYAWVIGHDGIMLYSPVPGFTGKSIFDNCRDYPSILALAKEMLQGHQGAATYIFDRVGDRTVAPVKKYAVYMPIPLGNSFWSIAVASTQDEVLASLASFRNRLLLLIGIFLIGGVLFSLLVAKAWLIVAEEKQRRKAEQELRESEERFRAIFNAANDAIFIHDLETGKILDVNRKMCEMFGLSREEALQTEVGAISSGVPPYTQEDAVGWLRKAAAGVPQLFEWHARDKAGLLFWVEVNMRRAAIGPEERIVVSVRDITERKQAEESLLKSKEVLRIFVEHSPAAIAMFDRDMKYLVASRRFLIDYDLGDREVTGLSHYEVFPEISENWREIHRRCLAGAVEKCDEDPFPRPDGKIDWVRWEIRPWHEPKGEIGGIILFSEVITERKNVELELIKHREKLEELVKERTVNLENKTQELERSQTAMQYLLEDVNEAKNDLILANERLKEVDHLKSLFIASMSHELRTPLNSIIGFTGILLQGLAGELNVEQRKQLGMVKGSSEHLLSLITDIIDLSKIEAGKIDLDLQPFDLAGMVREVLGSFQVLAERKALALSAEIPPVFGLVSDKRRLRQVLVNLVGNAVKFTDRGGVVVTARVNNGFAEIAVRDTGIGIKPEDMDKLFKSFSQVTTVEAPKHEGTGLGLYLSRRLINLLGGEISVESKFGQGSVFSFTLPIKR